MTNPEFNKLKEGKALCVERTLDKGCYLEKVQDKYYKSTYDVEGNLKEWQEVDEEMCKAILLDKQEIENV